MALSSLISKSEWARRRGFSPSYVTQLLREGKIRETRGQIDPEDADKRLAACSERLSTRGRPKRQDRSALPDILLRIRIKKEREEGLIKELERKKRQGELVDAEEVKSAMKARELAEREALLAWPRRVSADMAVDLGVEERLLLQIQQKYIREFLAERSKPSS